MRNGVITENVLWTGAGDLAYARGHAYFEPGAVIDLVVTDETINARVGGGDEYAVQLWAEGKRLGYSCTCPVVARKTCGFLSPGRAKGITPPTPRKSTVTASMASLSKRITPPMMKPSPSLLGSAT